MPSNPESSGQGRPMYPPQGLKRPPHPIDREQESRLTEPLSLVPWGRLGHRRQNFPVQLLHALPQTAQVAAGQRGTPMRMRKWHQESELPPEPRVTVTGPLARGTAVSEAGKTAGPQSRFLGFRRWPPVPEIVASVPRFQESGWARPG
ncbi:hypothetical protein P7K49_036199 [Saguinus oedipus]|uniref:Uncharacterized protein n=1 Tax=Saguinus oedipus TaxID=9490 RepID=A0ABQ9TJI4_SAGOE|nr:hypothetical protein P7K49_036199 [Saguinus oedipus]